MDIEATLNGFIRRDLITDGPVLIRVDGPAEGAPMPWEAAPPITIHDARHLQTGAAEDTFFARHGFALLPQASAVVDWDSGGDTPLEHNEIARLYLPEIEAVIRQRLLPEQKLEVEQWPHIVRRGPGSNGYAMGVHNDYGLTADDYQESVEAFSTPHFAAAWRARFDRPEVVGFMVINFWRPVYNDQPLRHMPLAVCDPSSVELNDVVPAALVGFAPSGKNTNQLSLRYNPGQTWWTYPGMLRDEVLAFKIFEYFKDKGAGQDADHLRTCFHTAFADPTAPQDANKRESCEHRVGVFIVRG